MAEIVLDKITKRYPDGFEAVRNMDLDINDGEFMILVGPLGVRKVHGAADDRRARGHLGRRGADRRHGRQSDGAQGPRHRDGVPELRALSAHDRAREHGVPAEARRGAQGGDRQQGAGGREGPRPHRAPRPQAGEPLRRPAPARRDGPGDRSQSKGVPDGRAALQPRREAPRSDAHRGVAHPVAARHDDGLRHPRSDRGDDAGRPRGRDARRSAPAGGIAHRAVRPSGEPLRRRVHRLAVDELHARHSRWRHPHASHGRRPLGR